MTSFADIVADVERAPAGSEVAAFFDFDGTVISGYSVRYFLQEQLRRGKLGARDFSDLVSALTSFGLGRLGFSKLMSLSAQVIKGVSEDSYLELGEALYRQHISKLVYPESKALIEAHLAKKHTVVLVSSATRYQVEAAAKDLGFQHVLYSELEVEDGAFTGEIIYPVCYGEGKVTAAKKLAKHISIDFEQSFFYSDSDEDIPLFEAVGNPRPLNPNSGLMTVAEGRGWPVRRFRAPGPPKVADYLKSAAATFSLVPSFMAGLSIRALTGSKQESLNYSMALFGDTAAALIGLDLKVRGEEHLWSHRPAVFIFNHQSQADTVILPKLLRRDFASVGKKEIKEEHPLLGRIFEYWGTVLIDRADSAEAIKSVQALVDVLNLEGRSVALAPEGTRSASRELGAFKKGAFHLAMQAKVPIVPIVIHNAGDVQPKGEWIFRPAIVEVDVLPPIDTSKWKPETINKHVADVRQLFLGTLNPGNKPIG